MRLLIGTAMALALGCAFAPRAAQAQATADTTIPVGTLNPKTPIQPGKKITPPMTGAVASVLQGHNNSQNTGENYQETLLSPTSILLNPMSVSSGKFGKLFTRPLDGAVYAQPLFVPNVYFPTIPHQTTPSTVDSYHNVVYVATENNSIYAWDADSNANNNVKPLWYKTFNYPSLFIGPVTTDEVGSVDISPQISITGTPIITTSTDPVSKGTTGTMFFVSKVQNGNDFFQYLHALDLVTGNEKYGAPIVINATFPGAGDDSVLDDNGNPIVPFNALNENEQAALKMLSDGTLVLAWGGHGETNPLHGWVMTYKVAADGSTINQTGAFCLSPNGVEDANGVPAGGGVWGGGSGASIDEFDNIFVATGIGNFDVDQGGTEYAQSVVKINFNSPNNGPATPPLPNWPVVDYFTPYDWQMQTASFSDLGSGGVVVLPDGVGPVTNPNLVVAAGIQGTIYLLDRGTTATAQTMGFFNAGDNSQIVQTLPMAVGPVYGAPAYSTPNNILFYQGSGDVLKAYMLGSDPTDPVDFGYLPSTPVAEADLSDPYGKSGVFDYPGSTPVITGDGINSPITSPGNQLVWTLERQIVPSIVNDDPDINPTTAFFLQTGYPTFGDGPPIGVLHAYDANPADWVNGVIPEVYSALGAGSRDVVPNAVNFAVPTVVNGKVYVGSTNQLTVFGMLPAGAATGAQPDHYLVTGPVNYWVCFALSQGTALGSIVLNQKQTVHFMITAIGPDMQPIPLTSSAQVYYRDLGTHSLHPMGKVTFNNSASAILPYAFTTVNSAGYDIYVADSNGHTSIQPDANHPFLEEQSTSLAENEAGAFSPPVVTVPTNTRGFDHFVMQVPSTIKNGARLTVTVKTVSASGILLPLNGTLPIYDAAPPGIGPDGNPVPVQEFDNQPTGLQGWAYNNVPFVGQELIPWTGIQNITFNNGIGFMTYPMSGVGTHVLIVVNPGGNTGTAQVTVVK